VVRYSFIVVDLHHLLFAGLPAHSKMTKKATCEFTWSLPQGPIKAFVTAWLSDDAVALLKEYRRQCGRVSALDHARH